jgi:hypothetical protein
MVENTAMEVKQGAIRDAVAALYSDDGLSPAIAGEEGSAGWRWWRLMLALRPVLRIHTWRYRADFDPARLPRIGVMADEIESCPELARYVVRGADRHRRVMYDALVAHVFSDPRLPEEIRAKIREALRI